MASHRIIIGALLLLAATVASATKTTIVDDSGVEHIAETVCKVTRGSHTQIGRVSSIYQLVAFFKDLSPSHKLATCGEKYSDALNQLYQVVSQSNDNVCSERKLTLIEKFHHDFISRTWRDKQQQKSGHLVAPKMLILFFMHYAAKVSATCRQSLTEHASRAAPMTSDPKSLETIDGVLRDFSTNLGASTEFKGYNDITLLWNLMDKFPLKKTEGEYLSEPGNRKRVFTKAHPTKASEIGTFQRECVSKLKPIYGASVLPVLRLADLGYYQDKEQFSAEVAGHPGLRREIGVAQLCEAILPVKVFKDDTLQADQVVFITKEEAGRIPEGDAELEFEQDQPSHDSSEQNSLIKLDALASANPEEAHLVVKSIRGNIKSRERIFRRVFNAMSSQLRHKTKTLAGKLFLSSKAGKQDVSKVVSDGPIELPEDELEPHHSSGALVRRKRNDILVFVVGGFLSFIEFLGNIFIFYPTLAIVVVCDKLFG